MGRAPTPKKNRTATRAGRKVQSTEPKPVAEARAAIGALFDWRAPPIGQTRPATAEDAVASTCARTMRERRLVCRALARDHGAAAMFEALTPERPLPSVDLQLFGG